MKKNQGFTLIELMITVAIIGILSAIAYPAYQDQIRKSRRADAQAVLLNIAGRQQQFLLDTRSYAASLSDLGVTVPASTSSFYAVTIAVTNSTTAPPIFTVTATPQGGQAADKCDNPNTATLIVDQAGTKAPAKCW